jgi:hypothetical protein
MSSYNVTYKTFSLDRIMVFSAAILLMISAIQDFLDPARKVLPAVIIQAIVRLLLGIFMFYFALRILRQP